MKSSNRKHVQTNFHFFKKIVATEILVFDLELFIDDLVWDIYEVFETFIPLTLVAADIKVLNCLYSGGNIDTSCQEK